MASACVAAPTQLVPGTARLPTRAQRAQRVCVRAAATPDVERTVIKSAALAGLSATLLSAGSAQAAVEVANIAAGDNRFGTLTLLAVPALGWVAFNIFGPLQNQLAAMDEKNAGVKRGVAAGLGLTAASLLAAQQAEAAAEVMQVAASDNRFGTLALLAVPALGWVLFNILGPLQNQLAAMDEKNAGSSKKRGIAAGLGLTAASLLATQSADAAQQFADLAASDNRFGTIALLALPVLGWVAFNMAGPLSNQLADMGEKNKGGSKRK